jgi:hypothetical protein
MTANPRTRPGVQALLAATLLTAVAAVAPQAAAAPPFDEINDVLWCVDQTSQAARNVFQQYAASFIGTYDSNYRALKCKLHQHAPIVIDGDSIDWQNAQGNPATLQALYGIVRGTGTAWDPYVIQNWEFPGSDQFRVYTSPGGYTPTPVVPEYDTTHNSAITIMDTDQHFVIDRVYAHGWSGPAIRIGHDWFSARGHPKVTVQFSVIQQSQEGVQVFNDQYPPTDQPQVFVYRNAFLDNGEAVRAFSSSWSLPSKVAVDWNHIHSHGTAVQLSGRGGYIGSNTIESGYRGIAYHGLGGTIAWNTVTAPRGAYLNAGNTDPAWGPTTFTRNTLWGQEVEFGGLHVSSYWYGSYVDSSFNRYAGGWHAIYMENSNIRLYQDVLDCPHGCSGVSFHGHSTVQASYSTVDCRGSGYGFIWRSPAQWPTTTGVGIYNCWGDYLWLA